MSRHPLLDIALFKYVRRYICNLVMVRLHRTVESELDMNAGTKVCLVQS